MNLHPVVDCRDAGITGLLVIVEAGGGEMYIVGLPGKWREAHIHVRGLGSIKGTAEIELALDPERVEYLCFVVVKDIYPAVSPVLTAGLDIGFIGGPELDVKVKILEFILGDLAFRKILVPGLSRGESISLPIKQDCGSLGRFLTDGWALS